MEQVAAVVAEWAATVVAAAATEAWEGIILVMLGSGSQPYRVLQRLELELSLERFARTSTTTQWRPSATPDRLYRLCAQIIDSLACCFFRRCMIHACTKALVIIYQFSVLAWTIPSCIDVLWINEWKKRGGREGGTISFLLACDVFAGFMWRVCSQVSCLLSHTLKAFCRCTLQLLIAYIFFSLSVFFFQV